MMDVTFDDSGKGTVVYSLINLSQAKRYACNFESLGFSSLNDAANEDMKASVSFNVFT